MDKKKFALVEVTHHNGFDKCVTYIPDDMVKANMEKPLFPMFTINQLNPFYYADKCNKNKYGIDCYEVKYHIEFRDFESVDITDDPYIINSEEAGANYEYEIQLTKSFIDEKLIESGIKASHVENFAYKYWSDGRDSFIEVSVCGFKHESVPNPIINIRHDCYLYKSIITKDVYESIYGDDND